MFIIPKSPRWLFANNREEEGKAVLEKMYGAEAVQDEINTIESTEDRAVAETYYKSGQTSCSAPLVYIAEVVDGQTLTDAERARLEEQEIIKDHYEQQGAQTGEYRRQIEELEGRNSSQERHADSDQNSEADAPAPRPETREEAVERVAKTIHGPVNPEEIELIAESANIPVEDLQAKLEEFQLDGVNGVEIQQPKPEELQPIAQAPAPAPEEPQPTGHEIAPATHGLG